MAEEDARRRCALHDDRGDEVAARNRRRLGAGDACIGRPGGERNGDHGVFDAGPQGCGKGQRQNEAGKGEKDVGDAHQDRIGPAAEIPRRRADRQADRSDHHRHQHDDGKRDPCAVYGADIDVAAELVGAEPVGRSGRGKTRRKILADG